MWMAFNSVGTDSSGNKDYKSKDVVTSSTASFGSWERATLTLTAKISGQYRIEIGLRTNGTWHVGHPKLEVGDVATAWCMSEKDRIGRTTMPNLLDDTAILSTDNMGKWTEKDSQSPQGLTSKGIAYGIVDTEDDLPEECNSEQKWLTRSPVKVWSIFKRKYHGPTSSTPSAGDYYTIDGAMYLAFVDTLGTLSWKNISTKYGAIKEGYNGSNAYYDYLPVNYATAPGNFRNMLLQKLWSTAYGIKKIRSNTWYTVSFWAKGVTITSYVYPSAINTAVGMYIDCEQTPIAPTDGNHTWDISYGAWQKHTFSFKTGSIDSSTADQQLLFRLLTKKDWNYTEAYLCMIKMEEGENIDTPWERSDWDRKGDAGIAGPMGYFAGVWTSGVKYVRTTKRCPIVFVDSNDGYYWVIKDKYIGVEVTEKPSASATYWELHQAEDIVIARMVMAAFAKLASAIFYGDYMFSQYGLDANDKETQNYEKFNGNPEPNAGNPFAPYFWVNFLKGKFGAMDAVIRGDITANKLVAKLVYRKMQKMTLGTDLWLDPGNGNLVRLDAPRTLSKGTYRIYLPKATVWDGLELEIHVAAERLARLFGGEWSKSYTKYTINLIFDSSEQGTYKGYTLYDLSMLRLIAQDGNWYYIQGEYVDIYNY